MPSPSQIRSKRIEKLRKVCCEKLPEQALKIVDPIYWKARALFPTVSSKTCMSYAQAVFSIFQREMKS